MVLKIFAWSYGTMLTMMRGSEKEPVKKTDEEDTKAKKVPIGKQILRFHSFFSFYFTLYLC